MLFCMNFRHSKNSFYESWGPEGYIPNGNQLMEGGEYYM